MGRLEEKFGSAAVSRFDLVVESTEKSSSKEERDSVSLRKWYDSCQSTATTDFSYDFFCREWPDKPVGPCLGLQSPSTNHTGDVSPDRVGQPSADEDEQKSHSNDCSVSGRSSDSSEDRMMLLQPFVDQHGTLFLPPVLVSQHLRDSWYRDTCFVPSTADKPLNPDAVEAGLPSIFLASRDRSDEGLYTGPRPHVSRANLNRMIHRLTLCSDSVWLHEGEDSLLQECPVGNTRYRRHPQPSGEGGRSQPLVRFVEATTNTAATDRYLPTTQHCSLHLHFSSLLVRHHSLYSAEHVLASRAALAAREYMARLARRETDLLWRRVQVLRTSLSRLRQLHPDFSGEGRPTVHDGSSATIREEVSYTRRSEVYLTSLRSARQLLHASARRDRHLLTESLEAWAEVKTLREERGYAATRLSLAIRESEVVGVQEERQRWKEALRQEVHEVVQEAQQQHRRDLQRHQQQLLQWRQQRRERKAALLRQQQWRAEGCRGDDAAVLQAARDDLALNDPELSRPAAPDTPLTEQQVRRNVQQLFDTCHRPPGEPVVHLTVGNDTPVTPDDRCPQQEKRRRRAASALAMAVKVFINNKPVAQTPWCSVQDDSHSSNNTNNDSDCLWDLSIDHPIHASLSLPPRTVTLQLLQCSTSSVTPVPSRFTNVTAVASVTLPLGGRAGQRGDTIIQDERVEFISDKVVCHSHTGVGAGVVGSLHGCLPTRVSLSLSYRLTGVTPPPLGSDEEEVDSLIRREGVVDSRLADPQVDPNDPANARAAVQATARRREALHSSSPCFPLQHSTASDPPYFECDGESVGSSWFCSKEELDSNLRLQMLELREKMVPEFQRLTRVPALSSQILRSTIWDYEAKLASSSTLQEVDSTDGVAVAATAITPTGCTEDDDDWLDDVAERLAAAERLVGSVRRRLLQQTAEAAAVPKPEDMVQEEKIPDIGTLGTSLVSLLRPKRPLKPARKVRGAVRGAGLTGRQVKLIVNVARAFNVPVRERDDEGDGSAPGGCTVRPFVTASFQGQHARTSVADGPHPTWNQQLVLPFRAPNDDYSSSSLGRLRESIVLQLYDERLLAGGTERGTEQVERGGAPPSSLCTRLHNTWLAALTIPTRALLFHTSKIEGTFELSSPMAVLGYTRTADATGGAVGGRTAPHSTHITLYVTLEPTLPKPDLIKGLHPIPEPASMAASAASWQDSLTSRHPGRHYASHLLSLTGQLVPLCRLLRPLPPPDDLLMAGDPPLHTLHRVAWYVSLLPTLPDMTLFPGTPPITATAQQLLSLLCGADSERAMLLTCYCLHLGHEAYLLQGSSVCQGEYSCTLVREAPPTPADGAGTGGWSIWCPVTGRCYSTRDPFCSVKAVYVLASPDNVWGNCQRWADPARVNFSVRESSCWRPLYSGTMASQLPSLQPPTLTYGPPAPYHDKELRDKLTIIVRDAFMRWRPHDRTVWNRHACDVLRRAVRRLEGARAVGGAPPAPAPALLRLHRSHSVCGVCIQQGWSGVAPLLAALHRASVHTCRLPGVEFAVALNTHPYPSRVTSVWLYVASLVRRGAAEEGE